MDEVDIAPLTVQYVDLLLPSIETQIGVAPRAATASWFARNPVVTGVKHVSVVVVKATASATIVGVPNVLGGLGASATVIALRATASGSATAPVATGDISVTVNAVAATATADAVPVPNVVGIGSVVVQAVNVSASCTARIPVVSGGTDVTVTAVVAFSVGWANAPSTGIVNGLVGAVIARMPNASAKPTTVLAETVLTGGGPATGLVIAIPPVVSGPPVSPASSLVDNFNAGYTNGVVWTTTNPAAVVATGGAIRIDHAATPEYNRLTTVAEYNMVGSSIYVQIADFGDLALVSHRVVLACKYIDSNDMVYIAAGGNNLLSAIRVNAGTYTTIASIALNTGNHRWWRIRESGGTTFFDFSFLGTTWTNFASVLNTIPMSPVKFSLESGSSVTEATGTYAIFDNFNTLT